jgi:CubicO group peptidase (beta-lactamase class C family)
MIQGFGYATIDEDPVTPSTLFYCGSMTKSFTAAALSLLVDNSSEYYSISWDTPISTLLPDVFVLSDEWATRHITVADALAHRTGYPRHDYSASYHNDSVSMVKAFRYLPMSREPRVKWQYNNMMYGTLGYVVEHLTNTKLGEFFRAHLWQPMGMHDTFLHPDDALASRGRLAHAYYWNNDTQNYGQIPWRDETAIAGAGMSISSVLDFSRYLRHMINETGPISAAGHAALKDAHMISEREDRLFTGPVYYGFGWQGGVFQNEPIWWHSGLVNSMMSLMAIVPGRDFGFVAMLNSEGTPVLDAVIARVLYDYFDVAPSERFDMEKE